MTIGKDDGGEDIRSVIARAFAKIDADVRTKAEAKPAETATDAVQKKPLTERQRRLQAAAEEAIRQLPEKPVDGRRRKPLAAPLTPNPKSRSKGDVRSWYVRPPAKNAKAPPEEAAEESTAAVTGFDALRMDDEQMVEFEAEMCRRTLITFVEQAFPIFEGTTVFKRVRHLEALCEHAEAFARGDIRKLAVAISGRHGKSSALSVCFVPWIWTWDPSQRVIHASYSEKLSIRDSIKSKRIVDSTWYADRFRTKKGWGLRTDQNTQEAFATTTGGHRLSLSVGGRALGEGAHKILADDPQNMETIYSKAEREKTNRWFFETMTTRVDDPAKAGFMIVQQRLHKEDLIGEALARDLGYEYLCLPSEFDPTRKFFTCTVDRATGMKVPFREDWRTEEGQLLFPENFPAEVLADVKKTLGAAAYAAQHQQNPADTTNSLFKPENWRFWRMPGKATASGGTSGAKRPLGCSDVPAVELPLAFDMMCVTVDCTLKGEQSKDFTVAQVWAAAGGQRFLIEQHRGKFGLSALSAILVGIHARYPLAGILVEEAVVGPAVVADLGKTIPGVRGYDPHGQGSKEARAVSITPQLDAYNVHLPEGEPWLVDFVDEFSGFPGKFDDQVDAASMALRHMLEGGGGKGLPGMITCQVNLFGGGRDGGEFGGRTIGVGVNSNRAPTTAQILRRFR